MYHRIPALEPGETAAFVSLGSLSRVKSIRRLKRQIHEEILWLLQHGYSRFIVACGNDYGSLALRELSRLRQQGEAFLCYAVEVNGERILRAGVKNASARASHPDGYYPECGPDEFMQRFLSQASVIVTQRGRCIVGRNLPEELALYYRSLQMA